MYEIKYKKYYKKLFDFGFILKSELGKVIPCAMPQPDFSIITAVVVLVLETASEIILDASYDLLMRFSDFLNRPLSVLELVNVLFQKGNIIVMSS